MRNAGANLHVVRNLTFGRKQGKNIVAALDPSVIVGPRKLRGTRRRAQTGRLIPSSPPAVIGHVRDILSHDVTNQVEGRKAEIIGILIIVSAVRKQTNQRRGDGADHQVKGSGSLGNLFLGCPVRLRKYFFDTTGQDKEGSDNCKYVNKILFHNKFLLIH